MLLLEDGALLDVELEVGAKRAGHTGLRAEIADPLQLVEGPLDDIAVRDAALKAVAEFAK